jgi:glycosyltransferase involved in cell wall biosynthesis
MVRSTEGALRVLHVDTERGWRGGQHLLLRLARGMRAAHVDARVACPPEGRLWAALAEAGVPRVAIPVGRSARTVWALRSAEADVVVTHTSHALTCAMAWSGPLVGYRWVDFPVSGGLKYQRPQAWCAVSGAVQDILVAAGCRGVRVVPGGADPLPEVAPAADGPTVLAVGARVHHKGHDVLADAASRLPGVDIGVAGDGPLRPSGLRLLGPRDDVPALLAAAQVFVHPSRTEGLGMALVEALQAGVPVVASEVGGIPEVVGDTAILVPPEDPAALADALRRALRGHHPPPDLGRARVAARFTTARMVEGTIAACREVAL